MLTVAALRARWSRLLGPFVALCLGVALMSMTALVLVSANPQVPDRYAGTEVLVAGPTVAEVSGTFPERRPWSPRRAAELVDRLAAIPGVRAAVPDRSFYAQAVLDGRPVGEPAVTDPQGHGWSSAALAPYRLVAGSPPARADEVVLDRALALDPGTTVTLLTATGPARYTVSGTVDGAGFFVTDAAAVPLARGIRVIGLVTGSDADPAAVRAAATAIVGRDGSVLSGDARAELEPPRDARTRWIGMQVLTAMTALAGFVSIFVVASTFAFAVAQRRREFGLLRTVGATPRQVRTMVYAEALAVGAVAAVVGVLLGTACAPLFGHLLIEAGFQPAGFRVRLAPWPPAAAFGVGLVVALLGVWSASRRAGRVRPLEALREAAVDRRPMTRARWIGGVAATTGGLWLTVVLSRAGADDIVNRALYAAMALTLGLTLLAPVFIPPLTYALTWPLERLRGATGMLVRRNALTAVRRTASTSAPMLLTVGFAVLIAGSVATSAGAYASRDAAAVRAGAVLVPSGTPGLSDAAVAAVPGTALLPTTVYADAEGAGASGGVPIRAAGVDPAGFARVNGRLSVLSGAFDALRGPDTAVVSADLAGRRGWTVGGSAVLGYPDGSSGTVRLVAVVADGSIPVEMLFTRESVRARDPSALTESVFAVGPATGADDSGSPAPTDGSGPATGVDGPGSSALPSELGARLVSVVDYAQGRAAQEDRLVWLATLLLIGVSAGYTAVALANTLLMATAHRTRDLLLLLRSGATVRQVLTSVAAESALVVLIGTTLGLVVPTVALLAIRSALSEQVGVPVDLVIPWPTIAAVVGGCLALALVASVLPARMALRAGPGGGIAHRAE
ncbi:ABC transporter permease [Plantactinospora soyae]|uniref:ABC transport system permease protein n=1 Tax=Plantactinospora soyae TaxID=1544732 RepID=A0A927M8W4_9ACTN|nr:ABC transporter permease [Plantactinospora soyae]MBE1489080.1 putative ABC transport system permease protein [Plantactinospora soyae]